MQYFEIIRGISYLIHLVPKTAISWKFYPEEISSKSKSPDFTFLEDLNEKTDTNAMVSLVVAHQAS